MANETWLEVALNGAWTRTFQPRIPVSVEAIVAEGVACAREGAAIIHVHAYDPATGRPSEDAEIYARIIEGIRSQVDAIVYPTIDGSMSPGFELSKVGPERYRAIEALAAKGLLEWSVVDPGTVNFALYGGIERDRRGSVYVNTENDVRAGLALAARCGLIASYAIYEPGFLRLGAALAPRFPGLKTPIYRLMFSDGVTFGFPPRAYALEAYLQLLAEYAPSAPWMIAGLAAELSVLIPLAVERGGHVRTGLEDAPLGLNRSNLALCVAAAAAIRAAGGTLASPEQVRTAHAAFADQSNL